MNCPNCKKTVIQFADLVYFNPFTEFSCQFCQVGLRAFFPLRLFYIVTIVATIASFYFTFPIFYEIAQSRTHSTLTYLLWKFIPRFLFIPIQVIVLFLPLLIYTLGWAKLEVVSMSTRGI